MLTSPYCSDDESEDSVDSSPIDIAQIEGVTKALTLQLDGTVNHNRAKIFMARSNVSENSVMISQNYSSAFMVNRRIANENMDAMFRVRCGIIQCLPVQDELSFQFREAQLNRVKVDFLTFRSKADADATKITSDLAELAKTSVEINKRILEANEEIRQYNLRIMHDNNALLMDKLKSEMKNLSVETNLALLLENSEKLRQLDFHSSATSIAIDKLLAATEATKAAIAVNTEAIARHRRELIKSNGDMTETHADVAAKIVRRKVTRTPNATSTGDILTSALARKSVDATDEEVASVGSSKSSGSLRHRSGTVVGVNLNPPPSKAVAQAPKAKTPAAVPKPTWKPATSSSPTPSATAASSSTGRRTPSPPASPKAASPPPAGSSPPTFEAWRTFKPIPGQVSKPTWPTGAKTLASTSNEAI